MVSKMLIILHTRNTTVVRQCLGRNSNAHNDAVHLFDVHSTIVHFPVNEINHRECLCQAPRHDLIFLSLRIKWQNYVILVVNTSMKSKICKHLYAKRSIVQLLMTNVKSFVSEWVKLMRCARVNVTFVWRKTSKLLKFVNNGMRLVINFVFYKHNLVDLTT